MKLEEIEFRHEIALEDYNDLRESVDFIRITPGQARCALDHSLYKLLAVHRGRPVGMVRVVGDGGYVFFICDVIVHPEYQSQGLGRKMIENVLSWLESRVDEGETIMVNLMSALHKEDFYEKMGFQKRPFGIHGAGMSRWIGAAQDKERLR